MPRIYFDTEFENLQDNAGIISIGLTNHIGSDNFYAELSDTYKLENCSEFCKNVVIPLLQNDDSVMTLEEIRRNLWDWLESQGKYTILICDSPKDIKQLESIFPMGLPDNCSYKVLTGLLKWKRRIFNFNRRLYKKYKLRNHHALDDAIVNMIIFEGEE